jgi:PPK2 family polyphosphate:nucleotide phosphotransferase
VRDYRKRFYVDPDDKLRLAKRDTAYRGKHESEAAAKDDIQHLLERLTELQLRLYAAKSHGVLIVLQAMDTGGKDGTIDHVMSAFNPQGATVARFAQPTPLEAAHDFLWRVHPHAPAKGGIAIFNRSHYEDVLVVRVMGDISKAECERRYEAIRAFERLLLDAGTVVLKFFLHISKAEQLERFGARLNDPSRNWKICETDYTDRRYWDDFMQAYEDALRATSTPEAPWYVIPADHKWFRNLAVSQILCAALDELDMRYPKPSVDLDEIRRKYHAALKAE